MRPSTEAEEAWRRTRHGTDDTMGGRRRSRNEGAAGDTSAATMKPCGGDATRIRPHVVTWGPAATLPCYTIVTDTLSIMFMTRQDANGSCVRTRA